SLDLHFLIEQKAKSFTHLYMNFNGTAGIWRTSCINDAGGWHTTTLVEDLDLSYRAQMKGWKCLFLEGVEVDAELAVQMNAAQRPRPVVNPLVLAQFLIFAMLLAMNYELYTVGWAPLISVFMYTMMGPGGYLLVISQTWNGDASMWREKARQFFFLMFFSSGISVNNTVAV